MKFCSTDGGMDPDVVLVGIGGEVTSEVVAAAKILAHDVPQLRVRVVNVTDLFILGLKQHHPHGLQNSAVSVPGIPCPPSCACDSNRASFLSSLPCLDLQFLPNGGGDLSVLPNKNAPQFEALFTKEKPVIVNFHGYPSAVKQLLFGRPNCERFYIHGYEEEGTTTTPLDMCVVNKTDRFHLCIQAVDLACTTNPGVAPSACMVISQWEYLLRDHRRYILEHGEDSPMLIAYPDKLAMHVRDEGTH